MPGIIFVKKEPQNAEKRKAKMVLFFDIFQCINVSLNFIVHFSYKATPQIKLRLVLGRYGQSDLVSLFNPSL